MRMNHGLRIWAHADWPWSAPQTPLLNRFSALSSHACLALLVSRVTSESVRERVFARRYVATGRVRSLHRCRAHRLNHACFVLDPGLVLHQFPLMLYEPGSFLSACTRAEKQRSRQAPLGGQGRTA